MTDKISASIIHHFSRIQDTRINRQKKHQLQDIFFITLCAVKCDADNWVAIEEFCEAKEEWVADLVAKLTKGEVIAIDGKCLRRNIDKASNKAAIYMVIAWAQ